VAHVNFGNEELASLSRVVLHAPLPSRPTPRGLHALPCAVRVLEAVVEGTAAPRAAVALPVTLSGVLAAWAGGAGGTGAREEEGEELGDVVAALRFCGVL
jgi:hypothetical protein